MSSTGNRRRLLDKLRAAGWLFVRKSPGGHEVWRCPCGDHFATITGGKSTDRSGPGPIDARIRRCAEGIEAARKSIAAYTAGRADYTAIMIGGGR